MSIVFKYEGFDRLYDDTLNEKIIVNDLDGSDAEVKTQIDHLVTRTYDSESLSFVPTCPCQATKGTLYLNQVCKVCNSKVTPSIGEDLNFLVWLRQPEGVLPLISPFMLNLLLHRYKMAKPSVSLVEYIIDTNYRITGRNKHNRDKLDKLDFIMKRRGLKRGYNSFVENFDEFIDLLEDNFSSADNKLKKQRFKDWVRENKPMVFSGYVPIINRSLFVFDANETGTYIDKEMLTALSAVRRFTGIDLYESNGVQRQNKTAKALVDLARFYEKYIKVNFYGKVGLLRKHISRTRSHFSMRAVISPLVRRHRVSEIELPWSASISLFRPLVLKGLRRRGYSIKGAIDYMYRHVMRYSPVIDEIFQEIIGSTEKGVTCLFGRNPSLHRGSLVQVFVTAVKTDPRDNTISMSYLLCKSFNADYDGDMMNLSWMVTRKMIKYSAHFDITMNVMSLNGPNRVSNIANFPKSINTTFANLVNAGRKRDPVEV